MKKGKYKVALHLLISIAITFIVIYILIFFGGWRLFEPLDPILLEIAGAIVIGTIFYVMVEIVAYFESKIIELEKRISELEK